MAIMGSRVTMTLLLCLTVPACGSSDPLNIDDSDPPQSDEGQPSRPPTPPQDFLDAFTVVQDLDWSDIPGGWYHSDNSPGTVTVDGRLTWHYPAGDTGGDTPGTRVILEGVPHGPYQYHREEGLRVSADFHGHASGVNKLRFWTQANSNTSGYLMLEGGGAGPLFPAINTQGWPMELTVLRWDDANNRASPTRAEAEFTRGQDHTLETLVFLGTPGGSDGFIRLWIDGVLILDFEGLALRGSNQPATFGGIHYAPVWGGISDSVPHDMSLSIDRTLVAQASRLP